MSVECEIIALQIIYNSILQIKYLTMGCDWYKIYYFTFNYESCIKIL